MFMFTYKGSVWNDKHNINKCESDTVAEQQRAV